MTSPSDPFSMTRLFITPGVAPQPPTLAQDWVGGLMTQWDAVSFSNTVLVGPVTYRNLPVVSPNGMSVGLVLLARGPAGYIIMGNLGTAAAVTFIDPIRYRSLTGDISVTSSTSMIDAGILNFLVNENTRYAVDGAMFYTADSSSDIKFGFTGPADMVAKWGGTGLTLTTVVNGVNTTAQNSYGDSATIGFGGNAALQVSGIWGWFGTTDTPGLLQFRVGLNSGSTAAVLAEGSWLRISELGPFGGANTFVKLYPATGSRSYDSSGAFIGSPDGDNNMYIGNLSGTSHGNMKHMWTFDAATMRSDLAGAAILSAQMYLYCARSDSPQGDYPWAWNTASTIQTTFPSGGFGGSDVQNIWTPPGWNGFDLSSQMGFILTGGANSVVGGPAAFGDAYSNFYGFGNSVATRPYIQVTYSV